MAHPEVVAKMKATLKAIGHRPIVRGGNGSGPTMPQALLAGLLGWPVEVIVPTGQRCKGGPPSHYKIDIADEITKVAIEVDGQSHSTSARREADRRKDEWLGGEGWLVLRFTNKAVLEDAEQIASSITSKSRARTPT